MNRKYLQAVILAVCAIVFIAAYVLMLRGYQAENRKTVSHYSQTGQGRSDGVKIMASVASLDPVKGELLVRLQFEAQNDLLDEDDLLVNSVTVYTNSAAGKSEVTFKKGESMAPVDTTVALQGEVAQFPWDRYTGMLWICMASQRNGSDGDTNWVAVPFTLDLKAGVPGFAIETAEVPQKTKGFSVDAVNFDVKRSPSSGTFSVFVMVLIGLLTVVAFLAGFVVVVGGRKVELAMLSWLGALLFALLPLRNAMPGAPPLGCLADYISFFWAEAIIAATLISVILTWVLRKPAQ